MKTITIVSSEPTTIVFTFGDRSAPRRCRAAALPRAIEDVLAQAIADWIADEHPSTGWAGTPTQLHQILTERVSEDLRRSRAWPATAMALGTRVERVAADLRTRGLAVSRRRGSRRTISITPSHPHR